MTETAKLEILLEKFRFTAPVSVSARRMLLKSRARVLKSVLKEVGAYSIWFGLVLFIILKLRKLGFKFAVTMANVAAVTATMIASAAVVGGTYIAVKQYLADISPVSSEEEKSEAVDLTDEADNAVKDTQKEIAPRKEQEQSLKYEILLYNGRKYFGSIESRGAVYKVNTSAGRVTIPAKQIKLIRRAGE